MTLPMTIVPGTNPPVFRWKQVVEAPSGRQVVDQEGMLPPSVEVAVAEVVRLAGRLQTENVVLRGSINMIVDRLGGMVEGKPTHEGNLLQRVDELVRKETESQQPGHETEPTKKKGK